MKRVLAIDLGSKEALVAGIICILTFSSNVFAMQSRRVSIFTKNRWPVPGPFIEDPYLVLVAANEAVADELAKLRFTGKPDQFTCTAKFSMTSLNIAQPSTIATVYELKDCTEN